jgi:broad specificity phosphatase PhoE
MRIWSPYESTEYSAKLCPEGHNIKILIRHSIRQEIKENAGMEEIKNAQLTNEGRKIAERFGKELGSDIGTVSSSYSQRCIDTCYEIINGFNENYIAYNSAVLKTKMLQSTHCKDGPEKNGTWAKLGTEGIFDGFVKNIDMPGFYNLEESVNRILDYIFETGNKNNTVDIFCTHDFQIAMLLLFFYGNTQELKDKIFSTDWPLMLECMFLWKDKNNLNFSWRGEIKQT